MSNFMRIEKIDQELNSIFKSPELLSIERYREVLLIKEQIDKIYMKNSLRQVEDIYSQMNDMYRCDVITKEEEKSLEKLEQKLNQLFINKSQADISIEDEERLEVLNAKIDALYEMQEPTIEEIEKAEKLLYEKEMLYAAMFIQKGFSKSIVC